MYEVIEKSTGFIIATGDETENEAWETAKYLGYDLDNIIIVKVS